KLQGLAPESKLQDVEVHRLRFYLHGESITIKTLYEHLFCHLHDVALKIPGTDDPIYLGAESVQPVGFGLDSDILPYPQNAHPGYMLLQEFFSFPKQYLFFDLCFDQPNLQRRGTTNTWLDFFDPKSPV